METSISKSALVPPLPKCSPKLLSTLCPLNFLLPMDKILHPVGVKTQIPVPSLAYAHHTKVGSWQALLRIPAGYRGDRGRNAARLCWCVCLAIVNRDRRHMRCQHLSLSLPPHRSASPVHAFDLVSSPLASPVSPSPPPQHSPSLLSTSSKAD